MQYTAVHLLKTSWAPSNSWSFYIKHIVALDLFCCHCRRCSYLSGLGLLQLCRAIQWSVNKADCCRCLSQCPGKNKTRGASHQWNSGCWHWLCIRFWDWRFWRLFGEEEDQNQQQASAEIETGCNKWWITNLETASRKEHKYSPFCKSTESCEEKWGPIYQQRQLTTVCVDVVFHRNFSSAGWTDHRVLPATLREAGAADCLTLRCRTWWHLLP